MEQVKKPGGNRPKKDFEIDAIACPARAGNPARDQTYVNMLHMFNNVQYS